MWKIPGQSIVSLISILGVILFVYYGAVINSGEIFSNGSLSMKHKNIEESCDSCHTPWEGVSEQLCKKCHISQKHPSKSSANKEISDTGGQKDCIDCHHEHNGRYYNLTVVEDNQCSVCHKPEKHPSAVYRDARPGIILKHLGNIKKGVDEEDACSRRCHTEGYNKEKFIKEHLIDIMFSHMKKTGIKCLDCHSKVKVVGFEASGGGVDVAKCFNCHKERKVTGDCVMCHTYHMEQYATVSP